VKTLKKMIAISMLLSFGLLNSTSYAQSQDDIAKQFVGMWRLVSWPQRQAEGTTRQNLQSVAYLIYTDKGHRCYVGMIPSRPKWKSATEALLLRTPAPRATAPLSKFMRKRDM
jgi:hypothetical protein